MPSHSTDDLAALLRGAEVGPDTPLTVGQPVQAEWGGRWWPAEVVALPAGAKAGAGAAGQVTIHYTGWDDHWDEAVPFARLRLAGDAPRRVVAHFDGGRTVAGLLRQTLEEFLLVERDGGRRVLLSRRHLVQLELDD